MLMLYNMPDNHNGQLINPTTNRWVNVTGKIGQAILLQKKVKAT